MSKSPSGKASVGPSDEARSACSLRKAASLTIQFEQVVGSGDENAVSRLFADEEFFHWFSDSNVDPAVAIFERDRAIAYIAHDAPVYRLQEISVSPRADEAAADVVFLVADPSGNAKLGKGAIRCSPPAVSAWTIGSPPTNAGSRQLCDPEHSIRMNGTAFCLR